MIPLLLVLGGCGPGQGTLEAAQEAADDALSAHDDPSLAIVRVSVDDPERITMVWGVPTWGAIDLDQWLAECSVPPGVEVSADLEVAPGQYPWEFRQQLAEGLPDGCVWERLSRLPLDEPSERGRADLYRIRWQAPPREPPKGDDPRGTESHSPGRAHVEPALVPPYLRWADAPSRIDLATVRMEHGLVRYRGHADGNVQRIDVSAAVPLLECRASSPQLVRTLLVVHSGTLEEVVTEPRDECVERRAHESEDALMDLRLAGPEELGGYSGALLVLDVPGGGA